MMTAPQHKNRVLTGLLLAFIVGMVSLSYGQGDDIFCAGYAKLAIAQNRENLERGLGFAYPVWSSDYSHHFDWCMRVSMALADAGSLSRAIALEQAGADPRCTFMMIADVRLNSISVQDEADGPGNAEPYLFPIFFKLDGETISFLNAPVGRWIHAPGGAHGNIGGDWDAGDVRAVPESLGRWLVTLRSGTLPNGRPLPRSSIAVGAVFILLEEDQSPSDGSIRNLYSGMVTRVASELQAAVGNNLNYIDFANSSTYRLFANAAQKRIQQAIIENADLDFWEWVGISLIPIVGLPIIIFAGNVDDYIGSGVFIWTWDDLQNNPYRTVSRAWNGSTGSEDGDFTVQVEARNLGVVCR